MKWAMIGLGAMALVQSGLAYANPQTADLWVGFQNSDDGFLLDEQSGDLWMTGACLKPLEPATRQGAIWTSHTVELVSVGRSQATLDQQFSIEIIDAEIATVTVVSAGRGGAQSFQAITDRNCTLGSGGKCERLIQTQVPCQG